MTRKRPLKEPLAELLEGLRVAIQTTEERKVRAKLRKRTLDPLFGEFGEIFSDCFLPIYAPEPGTAQAQGPELVKT